MIRKIFTLYPATIVALFALIAVSTTCLAQPTRGPLTITNNTNCPATVCLANGSACVTVLANSTATVNIPCSTTAIGVWLCGSLRVIQLGNCVNNTSLGGCCADVCFVPGFVGCTFFLTINPIPGPCACPAQ